MPRMLWGETTQVLANALHHYKKLLERQQQETISGERPSEPAPPPPYSAEQVTQAWKRMLQG